MHLSTVVHINSSTQCYKILDLFLFHSGRELVQGRDDCRPRPCPQTVVGTPTGPTSLGVFRGPISVTLPHSTVVPISCAGSLGKTGLSSHNRPLRITNNCWSTNSSLTDHVNVNTKEKFIRGRRSSLINHRQCLRRCQRQGRTYSNLYWFLRVLSKVTKT